MAARKIITYAVSKKGKTPAGPDDFKTAIRDSLALLQRGENDAAKEKLLRVIAAVPRHAEALQLMGGIALIGGNPGEAVDWLERALAVDPRHAIACSNLGLALRRLNRNDEALAQFEKAAALNPGYAEAHSNSGVILNDLGRFSEALAAYDRAIAINPNYAQAHCNRGVALNNLNRQAEAIASYDRAITLKPDDTAAHWNRCLVHLAIGNFRHAWDEYAWRWKKREITRDDQGRRPFWYGTRQRRGKHDLPHGVPCAFDPPFWDGSPNKDSLLVWPEQGVGEQLLYCSMLNDARARVGSLTLILQQKLHPLFQRSFPKCRIVTFETAVAENNFDWQIPLGDLGRFFLDTAENRVAQRKAYIKADRARTAAIRREIAPGKQRIVGLSWYSRNAEFGAQKTLPLDQLAPLLAIPGLRFVDLQYGDTAAERAALKTETGIDIVHIDQIDMIKDIDGLAALIDACDAVVTISNSNAHIAGALGKDVRLMLPLNAARFWYWQADRKDSLWYPRMQLLRQQNAADWGPVIRQVRDSLPAAAPATAPAASSEAFNEGNALFQSGKHAEALQAYDRALAIKPDHIKALNNRGQVLEALGKHRAALKSYEQALAIQPDFAAALTNLSLCHLFLGHFEKGWKTYDARWQKWAEEFVPTPKKTALLTPSGFDKPLWDGRKTTAGVLIWHEQGIGDCVLMASMVADVRKIAQNIILAVDPRLLDLFKRSFPECTIKTLKQARSEGGFDFQIPFGSLGRLFRNRLADFPAKPAAYLKADSGRSAALRKTLARPGQLLCGLSWSSSRSSLAQEKSMALSDLQPLLGMAGLRFVDLQYGDTAAERAALQAGAGIVHVDDIDILRDTEGLAALIDACDVIVTVSNTTAHIAGALGKPVWLMLPQNLGSFWYWQTDRDDTLWYPHVHVLRQRSAGDWKPVIEQLCEALPTVRSPAAKPVKKKAAAARKPAVKKAPAAAKKTTARKPAAAARKKKVAAK